MLTRILHIVLHLCYHQTRLVRPELLALFSKSVRFLTDGFPELVQSCLLGKRLYTAQHGTRRQCWGATPPDSRNASIAFI